MTTKLIPLIALSAIAFTAHATQVGNTKTYPTNWKGHDAEYFTLNGVHGIVVKPKKPRADKAWLWKPAFMEAFPEFDLAMLDAGYYFVFGEFTHYYASPKSLELGDKFYDFVVKKFGLNEKVNMEGMSRGGAYTLCWANRNPDKIAVAYADAPVCDFAVWPMKAPYKPDYLANLRAEYYKNWEMPDNGQTKGSPIDNYENLAKSGKPVWLVCGDSDKEVPFESNGKKYRNLFVKAGGLCELSIKPKVGHHPHGLPDPQISVDYMNRRQPLYMQKQRVNLRGSLTNSLAKFETQKRGRVAFVGGSITEMQGWRNMVSADLQRRFPFTEFEFVYAGIGSTGSTPHAFRLENDVLQKGKIDLMFVEAAVNDHTNGFDATAQIRGMEGVVRHALEANPECDIIMLHFIYDPFIAPAQRGEKIDVVENHEKVAKHYDIPSADLVAEIAQRMKDGEFDWDTFGGTHPKPFGHKFYAAAVARIIDELYLESKGKTPAPHKIPAPLDKFSYSNGKFLDIKNAKTVSGWKLDPKWTPRPDAPKAGTRSGFVEVPMLVAETAGATLNLDFDGTAIGIFCTVGPDAGILEYSIDGAPFRKLDTFTQWSKDYHLPWAYMLADDLTAGKHKLVLKISGEKNPKSVGNACRIRNFLVNSK